MYLLLFLDNLIITINILMIFVKVKPMGYLN